MGHIQNKIKKFISSLNNHKIYIITSFLLITMTNCDFAYSKGMQYDIGNNRKMYMECKGSGTPVVILIAGYPMRGDYSWDTPNDIYSITVFSEVSKFTTVCLYDRPGTISVHGDNFEMSRSTAIKQPVNVYEQVADLSALIKAANIPKPFIIVAHSAGGLIARMYAFSHPKDLAGLILLDVTTEDLKDKWNRKEWTIFDYSLNVLTDEQLYQHSEFEWLDVNVSFYQMQQAMGKGKNRIKLNIPHTVVMTADKMPNVKEIIKMGMWPNWVTQEIANDIVKKILLSQDELAKSFNPEAKHITKTNSGHNIQQEQPKLVVDEIKTMITGVRG